VELTRLVVGDDGSPGAAAARAWADALAAATGAHVTAVRVVGAPQDAGSAADGEPRVVVGVPAPSLLAAADEIAADLVVVGRRGAGGHEALRLGSTAHQVAEHATRPVAVVPHAVRPARRGWPFSVIAVGHDGSPTAAGALGWGVQLAAASASSLLVIHAVELAPPFAAAGLDDEAYEDARTRTAATIDDQWCAPVRDAGVAYQTVIEEGGPAVVLLDAVRARGADLLVVGRQPSEAFPGMAMGSVAHRALGFAPCPTIVVPAPR
jgi:nucleotide-binding universal stress UspA family protein